MSAWSGIFRAGEGIEEFVGPQLRPECRVLKMATVVAFEFDGVDKEVGPENGCHL